ncbi:chemotaxis protein [Shewanella litorisediminis]|uniref:Chemotaxis protein n=1 Tax=Shewanella litorisediminis TaxID=1173586 RepID=A0ABX7FYM3_9GAMM|nr:chemotaxis protein [Shewanella litorisediminis]MCL2919275.1 chemotaxis protein [Shewanella litorisediminis]QRH00134.1 chemotaxis protein [Shewanella litorisediminis]
MQIPPASVSGVNGFNSAQSGLTQATIDVARAEPAKQGAELKSDAPDKTDALVKATQSVNQAEASAEVIDKADETIGTIIDIKV